jgi:hypothetical protein
MSPSIRNTVASVGSATAVASASSAPSTAPARAARVPQGPVGAQNLGLQAPAANAAVEARARLITRDVALDLGATALNVAEQSLQIASTLNESATTLKMVDKSFQGTEVVLGSLYAGVAFAKTVWNVGSDVRAIGDRNRLDGLLKDRDLVAFDSNDADWEAAKNIAAKGNNRLRGHGDSTMDRLVDVRRFATPAMMASAGILEIGKFGGEKVAEAVGGGLVAGAGAIELVNSGIKIANTATALSNLRKAVKNSGDDHPQLKALAQHIETERLRSGKDSLIQGGMGMVKLAVGGTSMALGGPIGMTIAGSAVEIASSAVSVAMIVRQAAHDRELATQRAGADAVMQSLVPADPAAAEAACRNNIGVAEKSLLNMLRAGSAEDKGAAVKFLADFGVDKKVIFGLQVIDETKAEALLQRTLYKDRVKSPGFFKSLFSKENWKSFGQILGAKRSHMPVADRAAARPSIAAAAAPAPAAAGGPARASVPVLDLSNVSRIERRNSAVVGTSSSFAGGEENAVPLRSRSFRMQRSLELELDASTRSNRASSSVSEPDFGPVLARNAEEEGLAELSPLFADIADGPRRSEPERSDLRPLFSEIEDGPARG